MKIVIPDRIDLSGADLEKLNKYDDTTIYDDVVNDPVEIINRIQGAEIITANYIDIPRAVIEANDKLKYIIVPAVGHDWVDSTAASEKGIKVINCPTFNTYAVAEHAIGLIFAVYRKTIEAHRAIRDGKWSPSEYRGTELKGKKLLAVGYGNIGKNVVKLADALGMSTDYANSKTNEKELLTKISHADVVVLCYPLNDKTKGSFGKAKIDALKPSAILINVARGLVLDQDYLFETLKAKRILGAGLDVFNKDETLQSAREDIIEFAKLPNVVATPHIGFNTHETFDRLGAELFANIDAALAGNPINIVN